MSGSLHQSGTPDDRHPVRVEPAAATTRRLDDDPVDDDQTMPAAIAWATATVNSHDVTVLTAEMLAAFADDVRSGRFPFSFGDVTADIELGEFSETAIVDRLRALGLHAYFEDRLIERAADQRLQWPCRD